MIRINLIPPEYTQKARDRALMAVAGAAGGAALVVVGSISFAIDMKKRNLIKERRELEAKVKRYEEIAQFVDRLEARRGEIQSKNNIVLQLLRGRLDYPKLFDALVESLPPNQMSLTNLQMEKRDRSFLLRIAATGLGTATVIWWLQRLEARPDFVSVELTSLNYLANGTASFSLAMEYLIPREEN